MGKFAKLLESDGAYSPIVRKFKVHAKDGQGKDYHFEHESFSPRSVKRSFDHNESGHTLVSIKHGDKDVTNEQTLDEALRKVGEYSHGDRRATVHKDTEWGEHRVKHYVAGKYQGEESDYHEDDKTEAHNHAKSWAEKTGANEGVDRSEFSANAILHAQHGSAGDGKQHHIYVRVKGEKKNIAGPFKSKEEAEAHPARAWADGVHSE